ncbi:MAG: hypothetical protein K6G58_09990 [Lachnospiraceae bacterium]|nr:hypothetical protein [Lachnospiraceae bacterium]
MTDLSCEYTKRLNEIADEIKESYTLFVDGCSKKYGDSLYFWASPFSARNTYNDGTYVQICRTILAKEAVRDGLADTVIAGTEGEYETLKKLLKGQAEVRLGAKREDTGRIKRTFGRWRHFLEYSARQAAYRRYAPEKYVYPSSFSIVVGPAISTDFDGHVFNDRYTTGINGYHEALFLPYIVNPRKIKNKTLFENIRNCSTHRFIYDRDLVRLSDVLDIIRYWKYIDRIKKDAFFYEGIDVSAIVCQNLEAGKSNSPAFDGIMMEKMLSRLAGKGVGIRNIIQWYEGRSFDVCTASAARKYFPDASSVGYEGYPLTETILGGCVSAEQHRTDHAPAKMAIAGRAFEPQAHQFCPDVKLLYVPILRNDYVLRKKGKKDNELPVTVLVLLSYSHEVSLMLLKGVAGFARQNRRCRIIIKNHPTNEGFTLASYGFREELDVAYVSGRLSDCLEDVDAVVSSLTISTVEVAFAGISQIVMYPPGQLGYTCLPESIRDKLCTVVYSPEEITKKLPECLKEPVDNSVLADLLIEKTPENVCRLFER